MGILPDKYVTLDYSIVGVSAIVLEALRPNDTVSSLWDRVSDDPRVRTFERLADALTLVFAGGLINILNGEIVPTPNSSVEHD